MKARQHILDCFESLSPKLQAAARFVVDHPNEVVIASMRTVADRARAQPSTLVRLAQQLGYDGWPGLKAAFAADLGLQAGRYGARARSLTTRSQHTDVIGEMFLAQAQTHQATEALCAGALRQAVQRIQQARRVYVAGFRASFPLAYALVYGYRLFRDEVHLLDGQGGNLEMQMRPIARGDVVVAISFAPYSRESLAVVAAARAAGASILALTDSDASPLALAADASVLFSVASPSFFPSIASAMAVVEILLGLLVADGDDQLVKRIESAEDRLRESGAYVTLPGRGPG